MDGGVGPSTIQACAEVVCLPIVVSCNFFLKNLTRPLDRGPAVRIIFSDVRVVILPRSFYMNRSLIFQAGANMIVSGTAVVKSDNPRETINYLRRAVDEAIQKSNLER